MATFRYRRSAVGIGLASVVLALTLVFGFDGFEFVNQAAELLFWIGVGYLLLRVCYRAVAGA